MTSSSGAPATTAGAGGPLVTVSLVVWNGSSWLPGCLESLHGQSLVDFELLVIDNGSTDGSAEWLVEALGYTTGGPIDRGYRISRNTVNEGYAAAHDANILDARGQFVLLLNQDVVLDAGFLAAAVSAFTQRSKVAAVQGRLRRLGPTAERLTTLDTTGLVMHRDRRVVSRAQGDPDGPEHQLPGPVWGADGPAPVYRRSALLGARLPRRGGGWEVLDQDFFAYKEDVDLAWRLQRLGWEAWYEPAALAWHARGESVTLAGTLPKIVRSRRNVSTMVKALSWRNQRLAMVKNDTLGRYLRDLPWILRREFLSLGYHLVAEPRVLAAVPSLLRALPSAMRKRRVVARRAALAGHAPRSSVTVEPPNRSEWRE